jgi:hypothetical protein
MYCIPVATFQSTPGLTFFRQCGADGWVKKYEEELAGLCS